MKFVKTLTLTASILVVGCQSIPDGYSPEAWERLKRENPNHAQVVEWVHKSRSRRALRTKFFKINAEKGGDLVMANFQFAFAAEQAMLRGWDLSYALTWIVGQGLPDRERDLEMSRKQIAQLKNPASEQTAGYAGSPLGIEAQQKLIKSLEERADKDADSIKRIKEIIAALKQ